MSIFSETNIIFIFFFHRGHANISPFYFCTSKFRLKLQALFLRFFHCVFFVRSKLKEAQNMGFIMYTALVILFFEWPRLIMTKVFLQRPYLKESRWWCAHDTPQMFIFISAHNHSIPKLVSGNQVFAAPSSFLTVCYLLLDTQWLVTFSLSSLFFIPCSLLASLSY